jgi:hypothetical protein
MSKAPEANLDEGAPEAHLTSVAPAAVSVFCRLKCSGRAHRNNCFHVSGPLLASFTVHRVEECLCFGPGALILKRILDPNWVKHLNTMQLLVVFFVPKPLASSSNIWNWVKICLLCNLPSAVRIHFGPEHNPFQKGKGIEIWSRKIPKLL